MKSEDQNNVEKEHSDFLEFIRWLDKVSGASESRRITQLLRTGSRISKKQSGRVRLLRNGKPGFIF